MNKYSILSRAAKTSIYLHPYPHLVITDALDSDVYAQLDREFPADDIILDGRTKRDTWFDLPACKVTQDSRVSPAWREFFAHHTSTAFYQEIVALAGETLTEMHPRLKGLENYSVGMRPGGRGDPLAPGADVSMECQFYLNYTQLPRVVRGPHVDRPSELFAGLLYFRRSDDDSTGADLDVCEATDTIYPSSNSVRVDILPMEIDPKRVRTVKTAKYAANTLVLFLNSHRAIHAVTPRSPTAVPRRHINFCADLRYDLFSIDLPARLAAKRWLQDKPIGWRLAEHM